MLIAERNGIIGNGKGNEKPPLPYDYEVCYIESPNGNSGDLPYIDLSSALGGIKLSATIKWCPLSGTQGRWIFGGGLGSTPSYSRYGIYASSGTPFITPSGESAYFYYSGAGGTNIEVHDKQYVVLQTNYFSDSHIVLFCQWWGIPNDRIQARLFSATFKDESGKIIMDLIPVRFTNEDGQIEGAMYDKIGNSLYRKSGNLPFIIGPDTYKDYVQDGLIAMWDAIENAGPGVHDPTTTTWKDLSPNGIDMISNGEPNFGDNYMTSTKVENLWHTDETTVMDKTLSNGKFSFEGCVEYGSLTNSSPKICMWGGGSVNQGIILTGVNNGIERIGNMIKVENNASVVKYGHFNQIGVCGGYSNGTVLGMRYADFSHEPCVRNDGSITSLPIPYVSKRFTIGYRYSNTADGPIIDGTKIYNVRVYNRNLKDDEIELNHEVDRRRFKLYTAKDYVQDGLIAMWDGEWNAGQGLHDAAATTWVDLSGGFDLTVNNAMWESKSLRMSTTGQDYLPAYRTDYPSGIVTLEFCAGGSRGVSVFIGTRKIVAGNMTGNVRCGWYSNAQANYSNLSSPATFAAVYKSGTSTECYGIYKDGASLTLADGGTSNISTGIVVGNDSGTVTDGQVWNNLIGSVFSIRAYSRALTAAEIAANYAIDKARFNLPL